MHKVTSDSTLRYIVIAEFEVKPECFQDFITLASKFAQDCLNNESGCRQFDVVQLETSNNSVLFYEAYDNISAFEAHCVSQHLARFKEEFPVLIFGEKALRRGLIG